MSSDRAGKRAMLAIDRDRCEGHGQCVLIAPQLLHMDGDGMVVIDFAEVSDHLETAKKAVQACPAIALRID